MIEQQLGTSWEHSQEDISITFRASQKHISEALKGVDVEIQGDLTISHIA